MIRALIDKLRDRKLERYFPAVLIVAALGAMAISLIIGLQQSVWFDEAYSILLAKQPVIHLIHLTSVDTHPPLYYLLLKGWATLFGWSEAALRSLSVLAMGGAVVFAGLLMKRLFGVRAAMISLLFVVLAPFLLRYGFEIRMYSLASLIGVAATYVLVLATEATTKTRRWKFYVLYALLVAIGVYTLYYMVLLWLAHFVWLAWRAFREKKPIVKTPWFVAYLGSVVLFLPWLPVFITQMTNGALAPISQAMTIDNLAGIVSFAFLYQPAWQLGAYTSVVALFVMIALGAFTAGAFKRASKKERSYLWLLVFYMLVPIALVALVSLFRPMYVERYLSHVLIGGMLFVGVAVAYMTRHKAPPKVLITTAGLVAVLLIGIGQLASVGNYNFQRLQKPAVKDAVAAIGECNHDTIILAADPYVATELSYYMPSCEVRFYSDTKELSGGYAPFSDSPLRIAHPESQLANSHKLVYVYYDKPQLTMPSSLMQTSAHSYGALHVDAFSAE